MNNRRVIRRVLGDPGRAWVQRALEQGYELSQAVHATVPLGEGEVFGCYPATARIENVNDFERTLFSSRGAFPAGLAADSEDAVIQLARDVGGELLVLESAPPASGTSARWFPWRNLHEGTLDEVGGFLAAEGGWGNAFVIEETRSVSIDRSRGLLPADNVVQIADRIRAILVPAHDSETYVLWTNVLPSPGKSGM